METRLYNVKYCGIAPLFRIHFSVIDIDNNFFKNENDSFQCLCMFSLQLTMNDFSVHRIIGRGGFGEVYGCRKADTGKM